MASSKTWFVIINPTSGNGKAKSLWPKIKQLLNEHDFEFVFEFTKSSIHTVDLVHKAVNQGFERFICVGGDGTIHNTVNGIMSQTKVPSSSIKVGVIPIGTGNDWVKTYHIPKDIKKAIRIIKKGIIRQQDVGKIELLDAQEQHVYFNNLAGVGFDGYVVSKVAKYKHFGALAYLIGALWGMFSFSNFRAEVFLGSDKIKTRSLMVLIGLCKYSGGGMQLTKFMDPADGLFDISIAKNFSKLDILLNMSKLFNGSIVKHTNVETYNTSIITVYCQDTLNMPFIQADGELIGTGNFKVSIIPQAFSFYTE